MTFPKQLVSSLFQTHYIGEDRIVDRSLLYLKKWMEIFSINFDINHSEKTACNSVLLGLIHQ